MAKSARNEFHVVRNLHKNPQDKLKVLVMAGLPTKKVGAESGLVPKLAGGWLRPCVGGSFYLPERHDFLVMYGHLCLHLIS